ncbi:MAG: hypothetical protein DI598_19205 [Pseudopedobacter saltans]|uniref:Uncharacterized protein n=1 Tax=Pseudopedobacter saltans TaxID=151895 RepID=A0A2W5GBB3_9SPHI|nr:MAG: hypothetical protein DI598_19205 [Pseudopedobacter saltans]
MGINISLSTLLQRITPPTGMQFFGKPLEGDGTAIAPPFTNSGGNIAVVEQVNDWGTKVTRIDDSSLGQYTFMPVFINGYELPNALIMITGEKGIIETDLTEVGTVFEKVYDRPYDIQILIQLIGENKQWPREQFRDITRIYKGEDLNTGQDLNNDLVALKCALTDYFLDANTKLNFLITKISVLDNGGSESNEFIQIDGRSNIDFELELIN